LIDIFIHRYVIDLWIIITIYSSRQAITAVRFTLKKVQSIHLLKVYSIDKQQAAIIVVNEKKRDRSRDKKSKEKDSDEEKKSEANLNREESEEEKVAAVVESAPALVDANDANDENSQKQETESKSVPLLRKSSLSETKRPVSLASKCNF